MAGNRPGPRGRWGEAGRRAARRRASARVGLRRRSQEGRKARNAKLGLDVGGIDIGRECQIGTRSRAATGHNAVENSVVLKAASLEDALRLGPKPPALQPGVRHLAHYPREPALVELRVHLHVARKWPAQHRASSHTARGASSHTARGASSHTARGASTLSSETRDFLGAGQE
jgi:hypothetical protein